MATAGSRLRQGGFTDFEYLRPRVVLYMDETCLDDQIALEPAFRIRQPDGGWGDAVKNLEIVHVDCDHIQIVDKPYIAQVGADLTRKLSAIEGWILNELQFVWRL